MLRSSNRIVEIRRLCTPDTQVRFLVGAPMSSCNYCGADFKPGRNTKAKFCSLACQGAKKSQQVIDTWLENPCVETFYVASFMPRGTIRRYLIRLHGGRCSRCRWGKKHREADLPALEIEHKDGNWKNCHPENIDIICPNCHSLTDTYKARNRGNGRKHRRGDNSQL